MRVLVLDGNENQAVACVRSLARAGRRVLVGSPEGWSKAGWSHAASGVFRYPAPQRDAAGFVCRVAEEAARAPRYARDAREFEEAYEEISRRASAVLVQEFVEGAGAGYFALMREGEPRAEFAHRRVRDVRPTGSGSAVRVSVRPDPKLRE